MDEVYELKGTERSEKLHEDIPCGKSITTKYFHHETGEHLRTDVEIQVDPVMMQSIHNLPI